MNTTVRAGVSLLVGVVAFLVVGIAVSELLAPYVWPSTMIGLPAGLVAGAISVPLIYFGLAYRHEKRTTGQASPTTRRRLRTLFGATIGFVVGGGLTVGVLWILAFGLATAMLFAGLPVGLLAAAVGGYIAFRRSPSEHRSPGSTPP